METDQSSADDNLDGAPIGADGPHDAPLALRRVEAVLFLAKEPLSSRKISQMAGLADGTQARTLIKQLNRHFDEVGRAFHVKRIAGGYQLRSRPEFSRWLQRLRPPESSIRLSAPAMETLAVVAYRQPVLKAEIEAIRGVSCGEMLRQLMDRGLIRITGRSSELGHPLLYGTTRRFLEVFGLANLDALPRSEHLSDRGWPNGSPPHLSPENPAENPADSAANPLDETETTQQNQALAEPTHPSDPDGPHRVEPPEE